MYDNEEIESADAGTLRLMVRNLQAARQQVVPSVKWAPEEVANGNKGIRWVSEEGVHGRPTDHDCRVYLESNPNARGCHCSACNVLAAAPQAEQECGCCGRSDKCAPDCDAQAEQVVEPVAFMSIEEPELTSNGWESGDIDIHWTKAAEKFAASAKPGNHALYTAPPAPDVSGQVQMQSLLEGALRSLSAGEMKDVRQRLEAAIDAHKQEGK